MMRDNGLIGLLQVIHACVRAAFGSTRAWTVTGVILLILAAPIALSALLIWLIATLAQ